MDYEMVAPCDGLLKPGFPHQNFAESMPKKVDKKAHFADVLPEGQSSPAREQVSAEEVEEGEVNGPPGFAITDEMLEELPWHHVQLYQLYGEEADDFLHPKIDQEIMNQFVKPKRHSDIKLDDITAEELWRRLRKDSTYRLLRTDRRIEPELKATYAAFVRQCATQHKVPVKRHFNATDDVPEIDLLMDQSVVQAVQSYNLKCQLMYRSSRNNENKASILHLNNPFPNLNNFDGSDGIERYLPSWWDDDAADTISHKSYEKWLRNPSFLQSRSNSRSRYNMLHDAQVSSAKSTSSARSGDESVAHCPSVKTLHRSDVRKEDCDNDWKRLLLPRKHERTYPPLKFLTERETRCEGDFRRRFKEAYDRNNNKHLQRCASKENDVSSHRSPVVMTARDKTTKTDTAPSVRCRSEPLLTAEEYNKHFKQSWEPLTEKALVEYKQWIDIMDRGDYNYGKAKTWFTTTQS